MDLNSHFIGPNGLSHFRVFETQINVCCLTDGPFGITVQNIFWANVRHIILQYQL